LAAALEGLFGSLGIALSVFDQMLSCQSDALCLFLRPADETP
jgi:hypothetical protein